MIIFSYNSILGKALRDTEVPDFVDNIIKVNKEQPKTKKLYVFASSIPFDYIRVQIVKGIIAHDQVEFRFKDQIILVNEYGAINDWPKGFIDLAHDLAEQIVLGSVNLQKKNRKLKNNKDK